MAQNLRRSTALALALALLGAHMSAERAVAQVEPGDDPNGLGWTLRAEVPEGEPNFFDLRASPGSSLRGEIVALNYGPEPLTLEVRFLGGATIQGGGLTIGDSPGPLSDWIDFPPSRVELPARGLERIPFTIHVPPDAMPFEHVGGFVAQLPPDNQPIPEGVTIRLIERVGVPLVLTVGDPATCALTLGQVDAGITDAGAWRAVLNLSNTGNVHFRGTAALSLARVGVGDPAATWRTEVGYSAAGLPLIFSVGLESFPSVPGRYRLTGILTSEDFPNCAAQIDYASTISARDIREAADLRAEAEPQAATLPTTGGPTRIVGVAALILAIPLAAGVGVALLWAIRPRWLRRWIGGAYRE